MRYTTPSDVINFAYGTTDISAYSSNIASCWELGFIKVCVATNVYIIAR